MTTDVGKQFTWHVKLGLKCIQNLCNVPAYDDRPGKRDKQTNNVNMYILFSENSIFQEVKTLIMLISMSKCVFSDLKGRGLAQ